MSWRRRVAVLVAALAVTAGVVARGEAPARTSTEYRDGHARPRALAFNPADGLLYVALSTADAVAVVAPSGAAPRVIARVPTCRFPDAVAALPGGGALVACRFDAGLRRVESLHGRWRVSTIGPAIAPGARGLALSPDARLAYVASPATGGVEVVALKGGTLEQHLPTGLSPRALRVVPPGTVPGEQRPLLLVSSFIDHRVTVHPIDPAGTLGPAVQTIATEAPVLDLLVADAGGRPALWLATHEDRPLSRAHLSVEGLDSGVLVLPARALGGDAPPFQDAGSGRRDFVNLSERAPAAVVEPAALARDERSGAVAIVGAGTDNVLVAPRGSRMTGTVAVGADPSAIAALPGELPRWVTADRLSDTLSFIEGTPTESRVVATLVVGEPARASGADLGELMFYSRALTPRNVADGPLSLYTCAACHDDGHVDGRRHPSKRNRFTSMTKTCRGLATTAPYLSLGEPDTIAAFADNIVATHAQGAEGGPDDYDRYPVTLRVRGEGDAWRTVTLSPDEVRTALAAYMSRIPVEPSPFAPAHGRTLSSEARRGLAVFREHCARCHQLVGDAAAGDAIPARDLQRRLLAGSVALTSARLYDVGTPVLGKTGNNPPSLRGVWDAAPYFSDGSAQTLEDVLRRTDPGAEKVHAPANATRPPGLDEGARAALLAFLRAL
jgi:DNA-binding beta-propeller fold protein YncE/mono/diheme cytochrome c family protein